VSFKKGLTFLHYRRNTIQLKRCPNATGCWNTYNNLHQNLTLCHFYFGLLWFSLKIASLKGLYRCLLFVQWQVLMQLWYPLLVLSLSTALPLSFEWKKTCHRINDIFQQHVSSLMNGKHRRRWKWTCWRLQDDLLTSKRYCHLCDFRPWLFFTSPNCSPVQPSFRSVFILHFPPSVPICVLSNHK
jgi:hypothetical protein